MQSAAVVALALLESVQAFQAPAAAMRSTSRGSVDFNKSRLMMMMGMMMMMMIAAEPRVCAMVVLRLQTVRVCAAAVYLRAVARVERVGAARFTIAAVPSATEHAISPFRPEPLLCRAPLVDKGAVVLKPSVSCRVSIGRDAPQASSRHFHSTFKQPTAMRVPTIIVLSTMCLFGWSSAAGLRGIPTDADSAAHRRLQNDRAFIHKGCSTK